MLAIKILFAILFSFIVFVGAFMLLSAWIFDRVEISDHTERMQMQKVKARNNKYKNSRRSL